MTGGKEKGSKLYKFRPFLYSNDGWLKQKISKLYSLEIASCPAITRGELY